MNLTPENSTLVIIDMQGRLMPVIEDHESILKQCLRITNIARILDIPIIGTEQSPQSLGNNAEALKALCQMTVIKDHFDACIDGLIEALPKDRPQLILTGCETHICLMQTALHLLAAHYDVSILVDATGSRATLNKDYGLQNLRAAGAKLLTVEMVAYEWLKSSKHPKFKEVLAIIK